MSSVIEYVRDIIKTCPLLEEGKRVNVDYIGESMSYSIDALPCDPIITQYVDGGAKKQFQFAFTSKEEYDQDARVNIENSGFFEKFEEWLSKLGDWKHPLTDIEAKKTPIRFETLNKGYLYDIDGNLAKYRIECRFIYNQEV